MKRRTFLQISAGLSGFAGLPNISLADYQDIPNNDKSVILVYLSGGPSNQETFTPSMESTDKYRSVFGDVKTTVEGMYLSGLWTKMAQLGAHLNVVRSFNHGNANHQTATHWVMTGHNNPDNSPGSQPKYPSHGSIISSVFGSNRRDNGMPQYVRVQRVDGDTAAFLGSEHDPFAVNGEGQQNLTPKIEIDRIDRRLSFLRQLDKNIGKNTDSIDKYRQQAYTTLIGEAKVAFDWSKDDLLEKYQPHGNTGLSFLMARRLVEAGSKFITINNGGWDNHSNIYQALEKKIPVLDELLAQLTTDLIAKGRLDDTLIIVTGEFGRTPINTNQGRDHYPSLVPLMMIGGSKGAGRIIGACDNKGMDVVDRPLGPLDLQNTIFSHLKIPLNIQRIDNSGRPRYLHEAEYQTQDILS